MLQHYTIGKTGIDDDKVIKNLFEVLAEECFELLSDEAANGEAYPYEFKLAYDAIEYKSRDGFIPNSYNHGGFELTVFSTVPYIVGSGSYPSAVTAQNKINEMYEYNRELALKDLGYEGKAELTDEERDKLCEKTDEYGSDDTIMYQVSVMYHGKENGIHSATVQLVINWECPYHRSSSAFARGVGHKYITEEFVETSITWKANRQFRMKVLKAVKAGIKKLF